jgi:hypothetical protein
MKKQLFMKAFKALVVLVLFVGAVSSTSAQQLVPAEKAMNLLDARIESTTSQVNVTTTKAQLTPAKKLELLRRNFYQVTYSKIKAGSTVQAAIDYSYTKVETRNPSAAATLRQEVIDLLTKSN